jgi:hypothetical protein
MKIVHSKILGGWFIVRGPHHTPISGRFDTRTEARAWLDKKRPRRDSIFSSGRSNNEKCNCGAVNHPSVTGGYVHSESCPFYWD